MTILPDQRVTSRCGRARPPRFASNPEFLLWLSLWPQGAARECSTHSPRRRSLPPASSSLHAALSSASSLSLAKMLSTTFHFQYLRLIPVLPPTIDDTHSLHGADLIPGFTYPALLRSHLSTPATSYACLDINRALLSALKFITFPLSTPTKQTDKTPNPHQKRNVAWGKGGLVIEQGLISVERDTYKAKPFTTCARRISGLPRRSHPLPLLSLSLHTPCHPRPEDTTRRSYHDSSKTPQAMARRRVGFRTPEERRHADLNASRGWWETLPNSKMLPGVPFFPAQNLQHALHQILDRTARRATTITPRRGRPPRVFRAHSFCQRLTFGRPANLVVEH